MRARLELLLHVASLPVSNGKRPGGGHPIRVIGVLGGWKRIQQLLMVPNMGRELFGLMSSIVSFVSLITPGAKGF
jgi:hypothetical protein